MPPVRLPKTLALLTLAAALTAAACAGGPGTGVDDPSPAAGIVAAPPPGASPSEVYRLRNAQLGRMADSMDVAEGEAMRLMRAGEREALERVEVEVGELLHSRTLAPFFTDSALLKIEEWDAYPVEDRFGMYGTVMQAMLPSEFEVLDETIDGDSATLRVRAYFEEPLMADPGWDTGEVRFERQDGEWRIAKESWGDA